MILHCIVFPHYTFLWPEDGPQWPKHVVSLTKQMQGQLCFFVRTCCHLLCFVLWRLKYFLCFEQNTRPVVSINVLQHTVLLMTLNVQVNRPPTLCRICKLCSVFPSSFLTLGISYAHARPCLLSSYNVARRKAASCWYKSSSMSQSHGMFHSRIRKLFLFRMLLFSRSRFLHRLQDANL